MIKDNIEKLFIIPFFKLIEIIFISKFGNEGENNYENLKEQYFGKDFKNIKILEPFKNQINIIDRLLYLTRPDLLAKKEKKFIDEYIIKYIEKSSIEIEKKIEEYYKIAKEEKDNIDCQIEIGDNTIAQKVFGMQQEKNSIKLFMCKNINFESEDFLSEEFND